MKEENKKITNYLRKAILAQVDKGIDFKNDEFYKISKENLLNGNIEQIITEKLFESNKKEMQKHNTKIENEKNIDENIYVIIAAKIIKTQVEGTQKKSEQEDLTGIFFMPAMLNKKTSSLLPAIEDNKLPWFPREVLKPMVEPELAIGDANSYDEIVSDKIYNIYKIITWKEYIEYCKLIYEKTTQCKFEENEIYNMNGKHEKILLEDNAYIFIDKTINPSYYIKKLYNNIIKQDIEIPLYENFIKLEENKDKQQEQNTIQNRKIHYGQMGGQYALSPSQRESLNHFNNIKEGEVLAVKGPPGTGKTTLLQTVVANQYVKSAIEEKTPPLIVATSTNNQAVTNIIESFGKITPKYQNNLEIRWIEKVNSFAMYFPSKQKAKQAKQKGFQCTSNKGEYTLAEIESEENIEKSKQKFIKEAQKLFPEIQEKNIMAYKKAIHKKILKINKAQNNLIEIAQELGKIVEDQDINKYTKKEQEKIQKIQIKKQENIARVEFWKRKYIQIPKLWKILSWTQKYKKRISNNLKIYLNDEEELKKEIINIELIEKYYANKIENNNFQIKIIKERIELIEKYTSIYKMELEQLKQCYIDITKPEQQIIINNEILDNWLDINTRYVSFWLTVHYYEAKWLEGEYSVTEKQKGTTFKNVLINFYKRLSMITPCMVMTFYMLPKQFEIYGNEEGKEFLYNTIDTLIVDEAGQVSTEIGACAFSIAKKAIVVGDSKQIDPVWGIDKPLDKSLAIQENLIKNTKEFESIEKYGITTSTSSIMKVACKASNYSKYGEKGLFLSEHRRCYNDIIQYCNQLVYKGKLIPLRGNGQKEILPKMGYYQIQTEKSKKIGTSRNNTAEAIGIARWILKNEKIIYENYPNTDKSKILGIITPFKEQANEIKKIFKQILPEYLSRLITVGTIHTFQGGERKIIIMSTTYGSKDGCFFIDNNKNIMNVAVSRAEDSFLVFGEINCLKDEIQTPSGLLKKYIKQNQLT